MNRNALTTIGVGILLGLILLFVVLASCGPDDGDNTAQPGASASSPGSTPSGSLPPEDPAPSDSPRPGNPTPSGTLPADPGEGGDEPPATDPVGTRTPSGGVDAGGGSGVLDRRVPLLVFGLFLLLAALGTARIAFGRRAD